MKYDLGKNLGRKATTTALVGGLAGLLTAGAIAQEFRIKGEVHTDGEGQNYMRITGLSLPAGRYQVEINTNCLTQTNAWYPTGYETRNRDEGGELSINVNMPSTQAFYRLKKTQ